ncbi:ester cyclase [Bdellovibrio sp. SKB1291214]|uniref:nuclear transport factor 2 family protein n=1 Tax=Bdellovibrio sp. SKB1291214 TaxID=1732569 RepID=UPI00223F2D46|nr:nuclear transport factor 2 family protein [Bdellovibrio sp. SKB1291214]UYL07430.1 ester cyclase [Bdellovibrio sp. SKB1291214]
MYNQIESVNPFASPGLANRQEVVGGHSKNEEFIRELYAIAEKQDAKAFADLFAEDGHFWDVSAGINYYGKETGKVVDIYAKAFPDMHRELYSMWTVGDTVFVELSLNGTQKGALGFPMGDLPATNKKMSTPCFDVFKIKDGKVVSFHCYTAATQLLGQLGVLGNLGGSLKSR